MKEKTKDPDKDKKRLIIQVLRRASYLWRPRTNARARARIERGVYRCQMCLGEYGNKDVCIDHVFPVIDPVKGFTTWDDYINRMFCDENGFQILCALCHDKKTRAENTLRCESRH